MDPYDEIRQQYRPDHIKVLLIAESPPPASGAPSSRHFYRSDKVRKDDRLFVNTIKALYPAATGQPEAELEQSKAQWLKKFQADGWYMIEALETSLAHRVTKPERQRLIRNSLPRLISRVQQLASRHTKLILIKSNVFEVAAEPLRSAGFTVLNSELLDYPGQFNQRVYREKLSKMAAQV
jgi:hypothetical protein